MDTVEAVDIKDKILKYGKYVGILLLLVGVFFLIKGCESGYSSIEKDLVNEAKKYVEKNKTYVGENKEIFISITDLDEIKGTELCSKASGVIVSKKNGKTNYQAILKCDDYETDLANNKSKIIKLNDDETMFLVDGEIYEEPYYTLTKEAEVTISGNVGSAPGIYKIRYDAYIDGSIEETAYRFVIVSTYDVNKSMSDLKNKVDPVITLKGDTDLYLKVGSKYVEPGYTAVDYEDGKISRKVKVEPNPSKIKAKAGETYTIIYSVTNSKGNIAIATRRITYLANNSDVEINLSQNTEGITNEVVINVSITGNDYEKTIRPLSTIASNYTYKVNSNGTYAFVVLDRYKNEIKKEIVIDGIDNIKPSGTCSALVHDSVTDVEVTATDNKGIKGYTYILDGKEINDKKESTYKHNGASNTVSVRVFDVAGNETLLKCELTKKEAEVQQVQGSGSYKFVATKNNPRSFANQIKSLDVAETHDLNKYSDHCLSFAYYYAYMLAKGDNLSSMSADDAYSYKYAAYFKSYTNDSKQDVLAKAYDLLSEGQPVILQVNGNSQGTSRHYVTVIGYKDSVTSRDTITEKDLIMIDPYNGNLRRMDEKISRFMISGYDARKKPGYGYQLYIFR